MNPKVSVIIPTANRPHYLPRAVDSALAGMEPEDIEVIVVPNGPDESWRDTLSPYERNCGVRVVRIMEANANIARNAGLAEARGEFVRFLDDDDYLIPEGALKQYGLIQKYGVDVVSGSGRLIDKKGRCFDVWHQPHFDDICTAVLGPWRKTLIMTHLYRKSALDTIRWNPETTACQDIEWLFDLCASKELSWKKNYDIIGVWQHHWGQRLSTSHKFNESRKLIVPMLIRTYDHLMQSERINKVRQYAVALALWHYVHTTFFMEPRYWSNIANIAQKINPDARPLQAIYSVPILCYMDPLLIQCLMAPKRMLFFQIRQMLKKMQLRHSW